MPQVLAAAAPYKIAHDDAPDAPSSCGCLFLSKTENCSWVQVLQPSDGMTDLQTHVFHVLLQRAFRVDPQRQSISCCVFFAMLEKLERIKHLSDQTGK